MDVTPVNSPSSSASTGDSEAPKTNGPWSRPPKNDGPKGKGRRNGFKDGHVFVVSIYRIFLGGISILYLDKFQNIFPNGGE